MFNRISYVILKEKTLEVINVEELFKEISEIINDSVNHGTLTKEVEVNGVKYTIGTLSSAESIISANLNVVNEIQAYFADSEADYFTSMDLATRAKSLSILSFAIKKIGDYDIHKTSDSSAERAKKARELRKVLFESSASLIDYLTQQYELLRKETLTFYDNLNENLKK